MEEKHFNIQRKLLLTWLILPILFLWLSTNYLIGNFKSPSWNNDKAIENLLNPPNNSAKKLDTSKPSNIPTFKWQGSGLITLWFDDMWITQYTVAYPLLETYRYKAALAVPTKLVGTDPYMSWAQIKRLQNKGWEITSHTRTHTCTLDKSKSKQVEWELAGAQEDLRQLGFDAGNFVSPCGVTSSIMIDIAKKYYLSYRTSEPGLNPLPVSEPYNLLVETLRNNVKLSEVKNWIQQTKTTHSWLILLFHRIDNSNSEYSITPVMLKKILDELKKSKLHIVLPTQALDVQVSASESAKKITL